MSIPSRPYYNRPQSSVEHSRFSSNYFSGTDTRIYFGDMWIDEVTHFDFTLQEQVAPIYGYASFTFDRVARGNRHIQGTFRINYRENGYLNVVMQHISKRMRDSKTTTRSHAFNTAQWKKGLTAEHLINNKNDFDELAQSFEDSLWGEGGGSAAGRSVNRKADNTHFYPKHNSYNPTSGQLEYDDAISQRELAENGFSIVIGYGAVNMSGGHESPGAAHTLTGVHLTGVRQVIQGDGMPIEEEYSFIAQDLDAEVGGPNVKKTKPANDNSRPANSQGYRPIRA